MKPVHVYDHEWWTGRGRVYGVGEKENEGEGEWEAVAGRTMEVLMVMEVDYSFRGHSVGRRGKDKDGW